MTKETIIKDRDSFPGTGYGDGCSDGYDGF